VHEGNVRRESTTQVCKYDNVKLQYALRVSKGSYANNIGSCTCTLCPLGPTEQL